MRRAAALVLLLALPRPARAWGDPYDRLAKALGRGLEKVQGRKAAVVPFRRADGSTSAGGAAAAAALETALVRRGVLAMVERSHLDRVLAELELQRSGLVSPDSARQAGRMAGADLLVTGTIEERGDSAQLQARLVRVETGEVLRAAKIRVPRSWSDAPPPGPRPGEPPAPRTVQVQVAAAEVSGAARKVAGRDLFLRYADQGGRPVLRVTDYTDRAKPEWTEVPIRYDPDKNQYGQFSREFSLAGRGYRLWADLESNVHIAPMRNQFWGAVAAEEEQVLPFEAAFKAWLEDVEARSRTLVEAGGPGRLIAYFESLRGADLRASILEVHKNAQGRDALSYSPLAVEVLRGRRGQVSTSPLVKAGAKYFRFRYDADAAAVTVEEVR